MKTLKRLMVRSCLGASLLVSGCVRERGDAASAHHTPPELQRSIVLTDKADTLQPVRLQYFRDTLYVSYNHLSRIDLYTPEMERVRSIELLEPAPLFPTSFAVSDSELFVVDHARRLVAVFDHAGKLRKSFSHLPDGVTPLAPFSATYYGGVLYLGDARLKQILAVSMADAPGITERGELILSFPRDTLHGIGFPAGLLVTPDGRMLVGDAGHGRVRVFTCDGRFVYDFETISTSAPMAPQAFALDQAVDPAMQDSSSFDPSGVRRMGRFHVVDGNNRSIHMYNALGDYVASYPQDGILQRPSGIAVDRKHQVIYVADPPAGQLLIFTYEI